MTKISLEVVNFEQELARIEQEVVDLANKEIGELVEYATEQLRVVTPVDTGEARLGWTNDIKRNSRGKLLDASIINEVEHISYLNNGHSKQAPKYFIEQVLTKIGILTP